jgi:hypothetical protein
MNRKLKEHGPFLIESERARELREIAEGCPDEFTASIFRRMADEIAERIALMKDIAKQPPR